MDNLAKMLCTIIRLENTPNGQKVACEANIQATCGTTYTWNGTSSCGPQELPGVCTGGACP